MGEAVQNLHLNFHCALRHPDFTHSTLASAPPMGRWWCGIGPAHFTGGEIEVQRDGNM